MKHFNVNEQDYNEFTQYRLTQALNENKDKLQGAQRKKIPGTMVYQNSLNILCGKQGSGKTMTAIKEIIKISENSPETHLLIYINKTGKHDDLAFEATKNLIKIPIQYVPQDKATDYLKNFFDFKQAYKEYKENDLFKEAPKSALKELQKVLYLEHFNYKFLHTIIMFEDTSNSPLLKNEYIRDLLATCRHKQVTCFLQVQFWKSLPSTVKENASLVFFFGGFPPRAFYYLVSQVSTQEDHHELYQKYKKLTSKDMLVFDTYTGQVTSLNRDY
jgi:hypothetical protein